MSPYASYLNHFGASAQFNLFREALVPRVHVIDIMFTQGIIGSYQVSGVQVLCKKPPKHAVSIMFGQVNH